MQLNYVELHRPYKKVIKYFTECCGPHVDALCDKNALLNFMLCPCPICQKLNLAGVPRLTECICRIKGLLPIGSVIMFHKCVLC